MEVTVSGKITVLSPEQLRKRQEGTVVIPLSSSAVAKAVQPEKGDCAEESDFGMKILVKLVQPLKQSLPSDVRFLESLTDVKAVQ